MARKDSRSLSLPRSGRLRAADFQAIFQQRGRREDCQSFIVLWRSCSGVGRVGFAVGRRLGGAVVRNRARRRLREAYRLRQATWPSGVDVVFVGRSSLLTRSARQVGDDMQRAESALARSAGAKRAVAALEIGG